MDHAPPLEEKSSLKPNSSESDEVDDAAEVEDSGSESSGSSMDESDSGSESSSADQESESARPATSPLHDDVLAEAPQTSTLPAKPDLPTTVSADTPMDGLDVSRESSVLSDAYEPPEPEDSPDEAYSPKLSPSNIESSEMDTAPNLPAQSDAEMTLTRKPQEQVVIASKGDALDVRWP